jgi:CheY-like chemotaxis protein
VLLDEVVPGAGETPRQAPEVEPLNILCARTIPTAACCSTRSSASSATAPIFVGTGAAAVEAVAQGSYDVVLMDVTLPDVDGVEATRRIRALPAIPAHADDRCLRAQQCRRRGHRPRRRHERLSHQTTVAERVTQALMAVRT